MLDFQQLSTGLVNPENIAHKVLVTAISYSYHPGRGVDGTDEALCDADAIAMSKDTGPRVGYGEVIGYPWRLGRISQEYGILTCSCDQRPEGVGNWKQIEIIGQFACLIAAAQLWFYITDSSIGRYCCRYSLEGSVNK
jgi:D-serine deaminase-like pyridoxal phosphate-dependent protein